MLTYLVDSLPTKLHDQDGDTTDAADRDYNERCDTWIDAYGAVTSVLRGPRGDGGFGLEEARREAEPRRRH